MRVNCTAPGSSCRKSCAQVGEESLCRAASRAANSLRAGIAQQLRRHNSIGTAFSCMTDYWHAIFREFRTIPWNWTLIEHTHHRNKSELTGNCGSRETRESGLGTRESGLGTRESGLGSRESGLGTRESGLGTSYGSVTACESTTN
jgi:hypothetical protein